LPEIIAGPYSSAMPNLYVIGLDEDATRAFSKKISEFFESELGTPRQSIYVYRREVSLYRDGEPAELPVIVEISWIRRPREHFEKAVAACTRIVRELGHTVPVQVELREKWDDAAIDGELTSAWAARVRRPFP
jgi:hypothetical protein